MKSFWKLLRRFPDLIREAVFRAGLSESVGVRRSRPVLPMCDQHTTDRGGYRTRTAYRPGDLIPIFLAISDFPASITITSPVQSSLRFVDLQLGQTGPLLTYLQFLQAFCFKPVSPLWVLLHDGYPARSTPSCLGTVGAL